MRQNSPSFAELFKKYRHLSEIDTLSEFGDLLAEEGIVYEDSLFARWQHGNRIPKERKVLLKIIRVFVNNGGIRTVKESNDLLLSVNQLGLSDDETTLVGLNKRNEQPTQVVDVTFAKALSENLNTLKTTKFTYWILCLFIVQSVWFIRIQMLNLHDTTESYFFNWSYGFIALSGALYGLYKSKKTRFYLLILISLGLLSEWLGVQLWFYYNLKGINVPFPSLADIGYAGIIPLYMLATLSILNSRIRLNKKISFISVSSVIIIACYSAFLQTVGINFIRQLKLLLDFIHPIGEIIPILTLIYVLSFRSKMDALLKVLYMMLLLALSSQFITDYSFMFADQTNTYVNAGVTDYLYVISYTIMALTIISFANYHLSNTDFKSYIRRKRIKNNRIKIALSV